MMVESSMCAWDTALGVGSDGLRACPFCHFGRPGVRIGGTSAFATRPRLAEGGASSVGLRGSPGGFGVVAKNGNGSPSVSLRLRLRWEDEEAAKVGPCEKKSGSTTGVLDMSGCIPWWAGEGVRGSRLLSAPAPVGAPGGAGGTDLSAEAGSSGVLKIEDPPPPPSLVGEGVRGLLLGLADRRAASITRSRRARFMGLAPLSSTWACSAPAGGSKPVLLSSALSPSRSRRLPSAVADGDVDIVVGADALDSLDSPVTVTWGSSRAVTSVPSRDAPRPPASPSSLSASCLIARWYFLNQVYPKSALASTNMPTPVALNPPPSLRSSH